MLCFAGSSFVGKLSNNYRGRPRRVTPQNLNFGIKMKSSLCVGNEDEFKRRDVIGLALSASSLLIYSLKAGAGGLPPEEVPRICNTSCEKELENVWWDCIAYINFHYVLICLKLEANSYSDGSFWDVFYLTGLNKNISS